MELCPHPGGHKPFLQDSPCAGRPICQINMAGPAPDADIRFMKKQKKSSGAKGRRQQGNVQVGQVGQVRRKAEQAAVREGAGPSGKVHESHPREKTAQHPQARRKPRQADDEQKRKLWDRKQAELAARRAAAESRRLEEDNARKRKAKIAWSATGMSMAALAGALAWYFA